MKDDKVKKSILLAWSGGKDSALCLEELIKEDKYKITLLTTITKDYERISMHGVRSVLLDRHIESLRLPIEKAFIPRECSNEEYERRMEDILKKYISTGVNSVAFGDIYLEDLKEYREANLSKVGMKGLFPLWKKGTKELAQTFIDKGFRAIITCVDSELLDKEFIGRIYDEQFIADLPSNVDPCGENGEFHSFVFEGPIFRYKIPFYKGDIVLRDQRFYFCDLLPCHCES